jgi:hypothetical protein
MPKTENVVIHEELYPLYCSVYLAFGKKSASISGLAHVLPKLREVAARRIQLNFSNSH